MKSLKKYQVFLLLVAFALFIIFACKKDIEEVDPGPPVPTPKHAWAVGSADSTTYGMVLYSNDGGLSWVRMGQGDSVFKNISAIDVQVLSENEVCIIGAENVIIKTTDGGITWQNIPPPAKTADIGLMCMHAYSSTDIWISGSGGVVYHSLDGGDSWELVQGDVLTGNFIQGIHAVSSDIVYAVGAYADNFNKRFLAVTTDAGINWDTIPSPSVHAVLPWIGVKSVGLDHIVVYGGGSYYFFSQDAGQSWTYDSIPGTGGGGTGGADINCLTMLDEKTWWGALDLDNIFLTENSGTNWAKQTSTLPGNMWLFGIDYFDRQNCIIVGQTEQYNTGKIIHTSDGGKTWTRILYTRCQMNKVSTLKFF